MSDLVPTSTGIELGPTSLRVIDPNVTIERLQATLQQAEALGDTVRWWIGDVLLYAESRWGEDYAQLLDGNRLSEHQVKRYHYVAEKIAPVRRRTNLSFSHHAEVASLPPADQDRLLALAEAGRMAVAELREAVRDHKAFEQTAPPPTRSMVVTPPPTVAVDAMAGLRAAREAIQTIAAGAPQASEEMRLPQVARGLEPAAKVIRRSELLEGLLVAVTDVLDAGVRQQGLPDPAVIVPASPWDKLLDAHQRITEGRTT